MSFILNSILQKGFQSLESFRALRMDNLISSLWLSKIWRDTTCPHTWAHTCVLSPTQFTQPNAHAAEVEVGTGPGMSRTWILRAAGFLYRTSGQLEACSPCLRDKGERQTSAEEFPSSLFKDKYFRVDLQRVNSTHLPVP